MRLLRGNFSRGRHLPGCRPQVLRQKRKGNATKLKYPQNTVVAVVVLAFGLFLLFLFIPAGIGDSPFGELDERVGPAYFPSIVAVGIIVAGAALLVVSLLGREPTAVDSNLPPRVLQGIALIAAYFVLFRFLGYRVATILCLAGFFRAFGERRLWVLGAFSFSVAFGFKWIFEGIFNIRLHEGILF